MTQPNQSTSRVQINTCGTCRAQYRVPPSRAARSKYCSQTCYPAKWPDEIRFWFQVDARTDDKCWEWTGAIGTHGYGTIHYKGRSELTHRVAYAIANGWTPDDMHVLHSCDNRKCVNPSHLSLGTNADNVADAVQKWRHATGERNGHAKLTWDAVADIRTSSERSAVLARRYGVSSSVVSEARRGKSWRAPR